MSHQLVNKLLVLLVIAGLVLSACAPAAPTAVPPTSAPSAATAPPVEGGATATTASAATQEEVTLTLWWLQTSSDVRTVVEDIINRYMQDHPNVKVELTFYSWSDFSAAMPAALAAGNPPDLAFGDPTAPNLPNYVAAGQVVELTDAIRERGWEDRLQPGALTFYNPLSQDKTYAIPLYMALRSIFYNKKILDEVGAEIPKTMPEFEAILEQVKAKGYTPLGMGNSDKYGADNYWLALTLLYLADEDWQGFVGGTMKQQPNVPWGGEAVRQGMEKTLEWLEKGYFNSDFAAIGSGDVAREFARGQMFAFAGGTNDNTTLIEAQPDFEFGFFNWPRIYPDKPLLTISDPGQVLMLPKDSRHPEAALDLIDWLLAPEVGKMLAEAGLIPMHKIDLSTVTGQAPFIQDQLAAAPEQTPVGWVNYMAPFEFPDRQGSELQKLLAGEIGLDEYMTFLQKAYDEALAE